VKQQLGSSYEIKNLGEASLILGIKTLDLTVEYVFQLKAYI